MSKESINYYLKQHNSGQAVAIVVGGAEELLEAHPNTYNVCIANRKGFIKIAIENGYLLFLFIYFHIKYVKCSIKT